MSSNVQHTTINVSHRRQKLYVASNHRTYHSRVLFASDVALALACNSFLRSRSSSKAFVSLWTKPVVVRGNTASHSSSPQRQVHMLLTVRHAVVSVTGADWFLTEVAYSHQPCSNTDQCMAETLRFPSVYAGIRNISSLPCYSPDDSSRN